MNALENERSPRRMHILKNDLPHRYLYGFSKFIAEKYDTAIIFKRSLN